jgi:cell wall assembly regulator SMI1
MEHDQPLLRINVWLRKNARRILNNSLNKGATEIDIDRLQKIVGQVLPVDLVHLYTSYNGMSDDQNIGNFFYGLDFIPLEEVISDVVRRSSSPIIPLGRADAAIDKKDMLNRDWLLLAHDHSHASLRVDLTPTPLGTVGQVIFIDEEYETGILMARSVDELIKNFANDLESGLYTLNQDALEDGNHYLEPDKKIDLVNWFSSERWAHLAG